MNEEMTAECGAEMSFPENDAAAELAALKAELREAARLKEEETLLAELYPGESADSLPEAVRQEAAHRKIPLAAAYALYLRRRELSRAEGEIAAKLAAAETAGALTGSCGEKLYSVDEIRAMSRKEIRRSYKTILRSLERRQG